MVNVTLTAPPDGLFQIPPALISKFPFKVIPVLFVAVNVPLVPPPTVMFPSDSKVKAPSVKVVPLPMVVVPVTTKFAPVVHVSLPDIVKFAPMEVVAQTNVPLPLIVKLE